MSGTYWSPTKAAQNLTGKYTTAMLSILAGLVANPELTSLGNGELLDRAERLVDALDARCGKRHDTYTRAMNSIPTPTKRAQP